MQTDDPAYLPVGTDVSAKYKGAFCEAKIKKVVRNIKCKVSFKGPGGSTTVTDEAIRGNLRVGQTVEVKLESKKEYAEAIITKIQDCSQYTVVFDDGDITTLRRTALCLKSGRHFAESETLDQLPLTHPEHFGNPVIGSSSRRGRRTNRSQSDDSDSETCDTSGGSVGGSITETEPHAGRVVLVQCSTTDKKRTHHSHQWFPGLVVAPSAQETVKIKVKEDYLVRSFKDGRYYTVPKKEAREFRKNSINSEWGGVEAAIQYLEDGTLPAHWERHILFGEDNQSQSDDVDSDESSDDEPCEEKDHFVAQLYKFMDDRGTPLNRNPTIANKDIDLYRLFNVVQKLGGYNRVTNQNQWKNVAIKLGFQPATLSVTNLCKQAYKRFLHSFDDFYRKLGVTLVAHPKGGRTMGRSLIRDKDKMHTSISQQSTSQSTPPTPDNKQEKTETSTKPAAVKSKEKEPEKAKDVKETPEKEIKVTPKEKESKDSKEKEVKEKESKSKEVKGKDKEVKEMKAKTKETPKAKVKDVKVKEEAIPSSDEEDSGDNRPLLSNIKPEKVEVVTTPKTAEKVKPETPKPTKMPKSAPSSVEGKKSGMKKATHRRNSLPRCNTKSDSTKFEARCKSSSSDSSTLTKKGLQESDKSKEKKSISDKDSDSSSRGSKNGKTPSRKSTGHSESTPPPGAAASNSSKKPRKRKISEATEKPAVITANIGDKLKVYYGPAHSESKVTYEAKVIEIDDKGPEILLRVHYTGWNTRYDEWIKLSRIADNLTQHSKHKHKDKGKRTSNISTGPPGSPGVKKARASNQSANSTPLPASSPASSKPHVKSKISSNNNAPRPSHTSSDNFVPSESDSDGQSDTSDFKTSKPQDESIKDESNESVTEAGAAAQPPEKSAEGDKEKVLKTPKTGRSPQVKRSTEGSQNRVKRIRLKQEDNTNPPKGRDFDLNEIRSELKGFEKVKPAADAIKVEPEVSAIKEVETPVVKSILIDKTPEKITEDIYEFKEPEPFEFEARKSEEKKKRPTLRIFDDLPQLKLSPTSSDTSPIAESDKPKSKGYEGAFDKLCKIDFPSSEECATSVEKVGDGISLFSEIGGEDSGDRIMISETEDSQEPLFTYQDVFSEKPYLPTFKSFTPAKNQETYSKKDASSKIRDIEDDFTNSPLKGEQSSDEDPIDAAIQRVNAHPMSDDSNDGDLLIKTPTTPGSSQGLLSNFSQKSNKPPADVLKTKNENEICAISSKESLPPSKPDVYLLKPKSDTQSTNTTLKLDISSTIVKKKDVSSDSLFVDDVESNQESKSEPEGIDVAMPEAPVGFLLNKEVPSIAEKVLKALSSAKSTPKTEIKTYKAETIKSYKGSANKAKTSLVISSDIIKTSSVTTSFDLSTNPPLTVINKNEPFKIITKQDGNAKKEITILVSDPVPKTDVQTEKTEVPTIPPSKPTERRKSVAELSNKSNKVLSETIQKLSSQISQPTIPALASEFPVEERSESSDSDDSDQRLIIDKSSEEESQGARSTFTPLHIPKTQAEKSPNWPTVETTQKTTETEKAPAVVPESVIQKDIVTKQPEEDSNISLLLCEETIPGSPAPENLGDGGKNANKFKSNRNLEIPFASAPSISPDQASKDQLLIKDLPREREPSLGHKDRERDRHNINDTVDTVMDNTPPITPDSSLDNMSPSRDQQLSDGDNMDLKGDDDMKSASSSKKLSEGEKGGIKNAPESPGAPKRGRKPRRVSENDDHSNISASSYSNTHRPNKYNFFVDLDPSLDGAQRIAVLTSRLAELRTAYHNVKAELASIDRRRKKLRRREREAKAAKAAVVT